MLLLRLKFPPTTTKPSRLQCEFPLHLIGKEQGGYDILHNNPSWMSRSNYWWVQQRSKSFQLHCVRSAVLLASFYTCLLVCLVFGLWLVSACDSRTKAVVWKEHEGKYARMRLFSLSWNSSLPKGEGDSMTQEAHETYRIHRPLHKIRQAANNCWVGKTFQAALCCLQLARGLHRSSFCCHPCWSGFLVVQRLESPTFLYVLPSLLLFNPANSLIH